jgi:hypothetical protein
MTGGRIVRLLALAGLLALTGCRAFCDRYYEHNCPPGYNNNCGCAAPPPPCCAPVSNYPVQAQPCAPAAPGWNVPQH